MSVKLMGQIWDYDLSHSEAWVLMALADHADHLGGGIKPGIPLIAWKTGYKRRQVITIMQALEARGVLVRVASMPGRAVEYRIDLSGLPLKAPMPVPKRGNTSAKIAPAGAFGGAKIALPNSDGGAKIALPNADGSAKIAPLSDDITPRENVGRAHAPTHTRARARVKDLKDLKSKGLKTSPNTDVFGDSAPEKTEPIAGAIQARPKRPDQLAYDAVQEAFPNASGGEIVMLRGMLMHFGTVKGAWRDNRLALPLSCDEIRAFGLYRLRRASDNDITPPTRPDVIARWVNDWKATASEPTHLFGLGGRPIVE